MNRLLRAAVRQLWRVLLVLAIASAASPLLSCSKKSSTAPCSDCGSGDVYWDASVPRCRDHSNGQFVKSCCCGH